MQHKKQLHSILESICKLNEHQWNNPRGVYDVTKGAALIIEEALEAIDAEQPRVLAREIVQTHVGDSDIDEVSYFDAMLDTIYIAIGELHKLGLHPEHIVDGLQAVHDANTAKAGQKDHTGKVVKPANFVGPEEKLEQILRKVIR